MEITGNILHAQNHNFEELINLANKCFHSSEVNNGSILTHIINNKCMIYIINSLIVGFILYSVNSINYICVHPDYRKKGIATSLINKVKSKKHRLSLFVRISNEHAINLYKKMGFVIKCKKENYYNFTDIKEDGYEMEWKNEISF